MQRQISDADLRELARLQRRGPARPLTDYAVMAKRDDAMAAAYRSGNYTMKLIAEHFSMHYATVSRAIRRQNG